MERICGCLATVRHDLVQLRFGISEDRLGRLVSNVIAKGLEFDDTDYQNEDRFDYLDSFHCLSCWYMEDKRTYSEIPPIWCGPNCLIEIRLPVGTRQRVVRRGDCHVPAESRAKSDAEPPKNIRTLQSP